jgi:DNA relaxase NicK
VRQYRCGIHWLSFVVHDGRSKGLLLYNLFFRDLFGELQDTGHGGRGFRERWTGLLEFHVHLTPSQGEEEYFYFEIPGQACEVIHWQILQGVDKVLRTNYPGRYHYSRLDFAFDDLPFTPQDVEDAIRNGRITSSAKRDTLSINRMPFEPREDGKLGTHTVNLGSRQSERMFRVYNRRGFTRLEMELKDKRADLVAKELLQAGTADEWFGIGLAHLRDFVSFDAPWWPEFTKGSGRAWATVTTPREVTEERMTKWVQHQVSAALSVLHDIKPDGFLEDVIRMGRVKRRRDKRYALLLSGNKPNSDVTEERKST